MQRHRALPLVPNVYDMTMRRSKDIRVLSVPLDLCSSDCTSCQTSLVKTRRRSRRTVPTAISARLSSCADSKIPCPDPAIERRSSDDIRIKHPVLSTLSLVIRQATRRRTRNSCPSHYANERSKCIGLGLELLVVCQLST